jgi:hypothetical protein
MAKLNPKPPAPQASRSKTRVPRISPGYQPCDEDCLSSGMNRVDVTVVIIQKRDRILRIHTLEKTNLDIGIGNKTEHSRR